MKPAVFELHRPASAEDAIALLAEHGEEAKVLAGGQSLVPLLAMRLASPTHLVDLGRVDALRSIAVRDGQVEVGAMVSHRTLGADATIARHVPLVSRTVPLVGHIAIRNRGTFGGSLAHADPAAEYPAMCVALGATMDVDGPHGSRLIPADEFFISTFTTALAPDELLRAVHLPVAGLRSGFAIEEIARRHGDFALAGAALMVELNPDGRVERAGIALFGVSDRPWRSQAAEAALLGAGHDVDVNGIAELAVAGLEPVDSIHASARYQRHVARLLVMRALRRALEEAVQ